MTLAEKKSALSKLYKELDVAQKEISEGKVIDSNRGNEIEAKAKECETLQAEVEQADRIERIAAKGREVVDPALPPADRPTESKGRGAGIGADGSPIVGYVNMGEAFVNSPQYKHYAENGIPDVKVGSMPFAIKNLHDKWLPVTERMRAKMETEAKATGTIGATVVIPDRIAEVVRTTEHDRLRLRDVLQVSRTNSNAVEYVLISSVTRAAAPVAAEGVKPEATMAVTTATAPVRTIAVHMPVTEQQLQDVDQIASMINNELLYDLAKVEEEQFMWGDGTGQNLQGILTLSGVPSVTRSAPAATQNIDRIKIAATDIMVAGGEPNAVAIHPIDWEQIVLLKDSQNRYLWALIETVNGPRIWGMTVVETVAMKKPGTTTRNLLVGDFIRGATVWDRQQSNIAVGWIDDQFIKNMRTIRAEERLAFGIKRPLYFEKYETLA